MYGAEQPLRVSDPGLKRAVGLFEDAAGREIRVFATEDGYVGQAVGGDREIQLRAEADDRFVASDGTEYLPADGFFTPVQPVPQLVRRLVGLK